MIEWSRLGRDPRGRSTGLTRSDHTLSKELPRPRRGRSNMHESPRTRRLRNDLAALERLVSESSVFRFKASGNPPSQYSITFSGKGLCRDRGKVKLAQVHHVEIKLGASYPRTMPEIRWLTPVYHPNISEIGMVCLGGYGTHWVPSVQLDELCLMLWDMARYHNYDIRSPYNRDAALWVANQTSILFPTDHRPLRDLRAAQGRMESAGDGKTNGTGSDSNGSSARKSAERSPLSRVRSFIERYGKVFESEAAPPPIATRYQADHPEASTAIATAAPVVPPGTTDEPPLTVRAEATPETSAPSLPSSPGEAEEFVFLEESGPATAVSLPQPPSSGEDILFIE